MEEKKKKRCRQGLYRSTFLTAVLLLLLLLQVEGVKTLNSSPSLDDDSSQKEKKVSSGQGQEQYEEHFAASSVGDVWQVIDMAQQEEDMISQATTIQDHLFDLAFCFNLASIVIFL